MNQRHRLLFVPALDMELVEHGVMSRLRTLSSQARCAEFLVSGLDLPECLVANVLWGAPPRRHGSTLRAAEELSPLQTVLKDECVRAGSGDGNDSARLVWSVDDSQ